MGKIRLQVTVKPDLVDWIDEEIKTSLFSSRSHAVEFALSELRRKLEKKET